MASPSPDLRTGYRRGVFPAVPARFHPSDDDPWLNAVLITASRPRSADAIEQLLIPAAAPPT